MHCSMAHLGGAVTSQQRCRPHPRALRQWHRPAGRAKRLVARVQANGVSPAQLTP